MTPFKTRNSPHIPHQSRLQRSSMDSVAEVLTRTPSTPPRKRRIGALEGRNNDFDHQSNTKRRRTRQGSLEIHHPSPIESASNHSHPSRNRKRDSENEVRIPQTGPTRPSPEPKPLDSISLDGSIDELQQDTPGMHTPRMAIGCVLRVGSHPTV